MLHLSRRKSYGNFKLLSRQKSCWERGKLIWTRPKRKRNLGECGIAVIFLAVPFVFNLVLDIHPQFLIGLFQGYQNQNSYEPRFGLTPGENIRENGIVYLNDIRYAEEYPNRFLDISYPDSDIEKVRPTFIYIHGGGFFGGDKIAGDPLAVNTDSNYLFDSIILEGYNLVNMNYALVPQYLFPTPELQLDQAIRFLQEHAEEYHLDMTNVIIMGQSGGAVMTAQYGAMISNPEYAKLYGIICGLTLQMPARFRRKPERKSTP